mmetsp:Transcript_23155/g.11173  ORF Transcript_23155/g.11173 Transcript_23155/m.11173 type:complete len:80 (-) Transcript_23155:206-445(-)
MCLEREMDIGELDESGYSVVHYVALLGLVDPLKILFKYNAQLNIKNQDGLTPLQLAVQCGNMEVAEKIQEYESNSAQVI